MPLTVHMTPFLSIKLIKWENTEILVFKILIKTI
jgi:hypothetical protein